jgi:hypothetical protein
MADSAAIDFVVGDVSRDHPCDGVSQIAAM